MEKARKLLFTILYAVGALLALFLLISDLDLVGRFPPEIQFQFIISIILFFPLIGFQVWNFISFNKGNIGEKRFTASLLVWAYYFSWHIINLPDLIYAPEHTSPISIIFFVLALAIGNVATFVKFDKYPIVSKILIVSTYFIVFITRIIGLSTLFARSFLSILNLILFIVLFLLIVVMQFADKFVTKLVADTLNFNDETKKEETKETKNESIITNNKPVKNASLDNLNDAIAKFKAGEITLEEYQAIKEAFIKSLYK